MTCKDCIHGNVCQYIPSDLDTEEVLEACATGKSDEIKGIEDICSDFEDKSKFIKLPYKIGDKIYHNVVNEDEPQEYTVVGFYCEDEAKIIHAEFEYNGKTYAHSYDVLDEGIYYYNSAEAAKAEKLAK